MPTPDGFLRLDEVVWPLTYVYTIAVPWGYAKMEITVDAPALVDNLESTAATGLPIFNRAIAPAISFLCTHLTCDIWVWKRGFAVDGGSLHPPGQNGIFPLGKSHGIVALMMSGHTDKRGKRRLYFPACPRSYIDSRGQLTDFGAGEMLTVLRGWYAGFSAGIENSSFRWLNVFPDAITEPLTGFKRPGFRDVTHVRLCQYTVPVPDYVP